MIKLIFIQNCTFHHFTKKLYLEEYVCKYIPPHIFAETLSQTLLWTLLIYFPGPIFPNDLKSKIVFKSQFLDNIMENFFLPKIHSKRLFWRAYFARPSKRRFSFGKNVHLFFRYNFTWKRLLLCGLKPSKILIWARRPKYKYNSILESRFLKKIWYQNSASQWLSSSNLN